MAQLLQHLSASAPVTPAAYPSHSSPTNATSSNRPHSFPTTRSPTFAIVQGARTPPQRQSPPTDHGWFVSPVSGELPAAVPHRREARYGAVADIDEGPEVGGDTSISGENAQEHGSEEEEREQAKVKGVEGHEASAQVAPFIKESLASVLQHAPNREGSHDKTAAPGVQDRCKSPVEVAPFIKDSLASFVGGKTKVPDAQGRARSPIQVAPYIKESLASFMDTKGRMGAGSAEEGAKALPSMQETAAAESKDQESGDGNNEKHSSLDDGCQLSPPTSPRKKHIYV